MSILQLSYKTDNECFWTGSHELPDFRPTFIHPLKGKIELNIEEIKCSSKN